VKKIDLYLAEKMLRDIQKEIDKYEALADSEKTINKSVKAKAVSLELKRMRAALYKRVQKQKRESSNEKRRTI
jgi:hypothetical protein